MHKYLDAIMTNMTVFPLLAAVFTVPYAIYCYRRYGSILFMRVAVVYSFILYLICVYCLAILPFPREGSVPTQQVGINLQPFNFVPELLSTPIEAPERLTDAAGWLRALYTSGWYEPIFNILMFFPLGVFLRYYFGFGKGKTLLCAFLLSLFLELTQLSATYCLAPYRYRLCDVNDLITNTTGGMLGYLCTPLFTWLLPSRERLNQLSYQRGERVSYVRRTVALLFDLVLIELLSWLPGWLGLPDALSYCAAAILYAGVLPHFTGGLTPGKALVRIRLVDDRTKERPALWPCMGRGVLLHLVLLRCDLLLSLIPGFAGSAWPFSMANMAVLFWLAVLAAWHAIRNDPQLFYERWTHTCLVSTVPQRKSPAESDAKLPGKD